MDIVYLTARQDKCRIAAASAQDWLNLFSMNEFIKIWEYEMCKPQGQIRYENMEINWNMELVNCEFSGGNLIPTENAPSSVDLVFEITFH